MIMLIINTEKPATTKRLAGRAPGYPALPYVLGRPLLAGMGDGEEAFAAGPVEDPLELARRMPYFRAVEADGDEGVAERQRLVEGFLRLFLAEVAEEAEDQPMADAQQLLAVP